MITINKTDDNSNMIGRVDICRHSIVKTKDKVDDVWKDKQIKDVSKQLIIHARLTKYVIWKYVNENLKHKYSIY